MRAPTRPPRVFFGLLALLVVAATILALFTALPTPSGEIAYQRVASTPEATNTGVTQYLPLIAQAVTPRPSPTPTVTNTPTATPPSDFPLVWTQQVNGHWQIFKSVSGGQPALVSQNPNVDDIEPALSWDGTAIAFASNRDYPSCPTHYEIYRMSVSGASPVRLTNTNATCPPSGNNTASVTNMNPTWAPKPDARNKLWIAFASDAGTFDGFDIYRVPADTTTPIDITGNNQYDYRLTWPQSPDQPTATPIGPTPTFTPTSTPYVAPTATTGPTSSPYDNFFRASSSRMPSYSPDGSMIAFASNRRGDNAARGGRDQIWVMTADGYNLRQVTFSAGQSSWPRWSPKGNRIAYASNRTGNWEVYSVNPSGTGDMQITLSPIASVDAQPTWAGSGTQLAFINSIGGDVVIYSINADGSGISPPITYGPLYAPAWAP